MSTVQSADQRADLLERLIGLLEQARLQGATLTYLEVADRLAVPGPGRIQQTAALIETLLAQDADAGRPIRAALVTSRARPGRPAPGFFDCAQRLGLFDGADPDAFHDRLLQQLMADGGRPAPGRV